MKLLFVCTGNTCRSPMAEGLAKAYIKKHSLDWQAVSAGLFINDVDGTAENAVLAMEELGIDISGHIPEQLTLQMADSADIVVPMTGSHREALIAAGVDENKIRLLEGNVPDPYAGSLEVYRNCRDTLKKYVEALLESLKDD